MYKNVLYLWLLRIGKTIAFWFLNFWMFACIMLISYENLSWIFRSVGKQCDCYILCWDYIKLYKKVSKSSKMSVLSCICMAVLFVTISYLLFCNFTSNWYCQIFFFFMGGGVALAIPAKADVGLISGWRRSPGEGNRNPLQYSCLGHPMDRGAWRAIVYGVAKSWTRLSD